MVSTPTKEEIIDLLRQVMDPEIPVLSLVDLGVISDVQIDPQGRVEVVLTPTFSGCPAMEHMRSEVETLLHKHGFHNQLVRIDFTRPWSTDMVTEQGLKSLKEFGLALPGKAAHIGDIGLLETVACPLCDSRNTVMQTMFGPTLCRAIHYCNDCRQSFEQFKPV